MNLRTFFSGTSIAAAFLLSIALVAPAAATVVSTTTGGAAATPTIHAVSEGGHVKLANAIANIECGATFELKIESHGTGKAAEGSLSNLAFTSCTNSWHVTVSSSLSLSYTSGHNGKVTSTGTKLTATRLGITCNYETKNTSFGTFTGGNPATVDLEASIPLASGSSFLCGSGNAKLEGSYSTTSALYVAATGGSEPTATTVTTSLSGEAKSGEEITVNEGAKVKDMATLAGTNASKATGKVTYKAYSDKECKNLVTTAGEKTVSGTTVPDSNEVELTAGKKYYWQAEYGGDANNLESKSTCGKEVLTVKAAVSLATVLVGSGTESEEGVEGKKITIAEGSLVADTATLSGTAATEATGAVEYRVYADSECKELIEAAGSVEVEEGKAPVSEQLELEAGTYYWRAFYEGDALHQSGSSPCDEEVTVTAPTSLTTWLSGEGEEGEMIEVAEGAAVTDSATITGSGAAEATGTVEYFVYEDSNCENLAAEAGEVAVEGTEVPASEPVEPEEPGTYYWQAEYSGDAVNHKSTSACGSEVVIATPLVTTSLSGGETSGEEIEVVKGTSVTDEATLHGEAAAEATGTVEYFVYEDGECEDLVAEAGEVEVEGPEVPGSEPIKFEEPGIYYWQAEYSGDESSPPGESICGTEVTAVVTTTSLTTSLAGGEKEGAKIEVKEGTPVSDQATLSGANAAAAEGSVDYTVYSDSECTEVAQVAGEAIVEAGSVGSSQAVNLPAGTYYWQAEYSGDEVNQDSKSPCGVEVLTVTTPITMSLSGESLSGDEIQVGVGAPVTGAATLHGGKSSEATGTVEYFVYEDEACEELVAEAGEVEVEGAEVPPSESVELEETGIYYWQAEYSGDENNPEATTTCQRTQETVWNPATWKYAALGDSYSSGEGVWNSGGTFYWPTATFGFLGVHGANHCHRSEQAWPALVAERAFGKAQIEGPAVFKYPADRFIFRACSGAETINIWRAGGGPAANNGGQYDEYILNGAWVKPTPAQLRFMLPPAGGVNNDIAIVSMTITGNDAGFGAVAAGCIQLPWQFNYSPAACQATIANAENFGFKAIEARLPIVLQEVAAVAPRAKIFLFLYPRVINLGAAVIPVGPLGRSRINNFVPGPTGVTAAWSVANFIERLNEKIINVANGAGLGARLEINGAMMGALDGHRLGNANPWINRIALPHPFTESFHPNLCGHRAMAAAALPWMLQGAAPIGLCPP